MKITVFIYIMFLSITNMFGQTNLPFIENWDYQGGFEEHGWEFDPEQGSWYFNNLVSPAGFVCYVQYIPYEVITDYDNSLVSPVFARGTSDTIMLRYDLDFTFQYQDNIEKYFTVEVRDSLGQESTWTTVSSHKATNYTFSLNDNRVDISKYVTTETFQVRFRAYGSELNINSGWRLENIAILGENHPEPDGTLIVAVGDRTTGNEIEGAIVSVADTAIITNYLGLAIFDLPPGTYNLKCTMDGFYDYFYDDIPLVSFDDLVFMVVMEPLPAVMEPLESIKYKPGHDDDINWSGNFGSLGIGGEVNDLEIKNGELYVGGKIYFAGNTRSKNIIKWDGSEWKDVDGGLNGGRVEHIIYTEEFVYALGDIETNEGRKLGVVRWDGQQWNTLGMWFDPNDVFLGISESNGKIYMAGNFSVDIRGTTYNNLIYFDESNNTWYGFEGTIDGPVFSVSTIDNRVYIGGKFTSAFNTPAKGVAMWDGNNWSALGNGINFSTEDDCVYTVQATGNTVYAGGYFTMEGGINAIAQWDGTEWKELDGGVIASYDYQNVVFDLNYDDGKLYVGGQFDKAGSINAGNIAVWDGSNWSSLGYGMDHGTVKSVAVDNGDVYIGGAFHMVDNVFTWNIAKWNGSEWQALDDNNVNDAFSDVTLVVEANGEKLYVGGAFTYIGNQNIVGLAVWDGTKWDGLNANLAPGSYIEAIKIYNNEVYVGGAFTEIGGVVANGIAKWTGTEWVALGTGIVEGQCISAIEFYDDNVYVGGRFSKIGDVNSYGIARFDGNNWFTVNAGLNIDSKVDDLLTYKQELYLSGFLVDDEFAGIKKWDGSNWSNFAIVDLYAGVYSMEIYNDELYIGGEFNVLNGKNISKFAKYSNSTAGWVGYDLIWYPPFQGKSMINKLLVHNDELYVAGSFKSINENENMSHIAKWDGNEWSSLGSGLIATNSTGIYDIAICYNEILHASGKFDFAGNKPSNNFARYALNDTTATNVREDITISRVKLSNYPNPFNNNTSIVYGVPDAGNVTIEVYNIQGQKIRTLVNEYKMPGTYEITWNGADGGNRVVPGGLYFYKVNVKNYTSTKIMVKL